MATNSTVIVEKLPTTNVVTTVTQSSSALSQFKGIPGKSAYQLFIDSGFNGSFEDWKNSLIGPQGPKGDRGDKGEKGDTGNQGIQGIQGERGFKGDRGERGFQGIQGIQGIQGLKGDIGKSAYEVALNNGFVGSQLEWLDSLKANLMINPSVKNHLLSNNGVDPIWVSIEDRLNLEEITWDLGEL